MVWPCDQLALYPLGHHGGAQARGLGQAENACSVCVCVAYSFQFPSEFH